MEEEKFFLVEAESRFTVKYLIRATDLTVDQAQQLIDEGLVDEFAQEHSGDEVVNVVEAPQELLEKLQLIEEVKNVNE